MHNLTLSSSNTKEAFFSESHEHAQLLLLPHALVLWNELKISLFEWHFSYVAFEAFRLWWLSFWLSVFVLGDVTPPFMLIAPMIPDDCRPKNALPPAPSAPLLPVRTFLWGCKRTKYTFGTNIQPRVTVALMLTHIHRAVICTCVGWKSTWFE